MGQTIFGDAAPGAFTTDANVNGVSVNAAANSPSSATFAIGGLTGAESYALDCTVDVGYGVTANPAVIYICRQTRTGFESTVVAWSFNHVGSATPSTTMSRSFRVQGAGQFQIIVGNPAGNSTITGVTLATRPVQGGLG